MIKCQQSGPTLFDAQAYNHFHFQKVSGTNVVVTVNCTEVNGSQTYNTVIPLNDDNVYEYFLNGQNVTCTGTLAGREGASVNYTDEQ